MSDPKGSVLGSTLRYLLWRVVTYLSGGLTVTGVAPKGPGIVVANHTSHGDTAIMFASLPPRAKPFAVAAADYWLSKWYKMLAVKTLVSIVPVKRQSEGGDAYGDLLTTVRKRIDAGGIVIVYPEGTRTTTGEVGEFKTGAIRLASDLQVPIYPAGILGISKILPKNGDWSVGPMEITFGPAVRVEKEVSRGAAQDHAVVLRDEVVRLKAQDEPVEFVSRKWSKTVLKTAGYKLFLIALLWGIAEAISWPLLAESCLMFLAIVTPRRVMPAAFFLSVGSAIGVCIMTAMAYYGVNAPMPLTSLKMLTEATSNMAIGYDQLDKQLFSGIPVKVYARAAGDVAESSGVAPDYGSLFLYSFLYRGLRIGGIGILVTVAGWMARKYIKKHYTLLFYGGFIVFLLALHRVAQQWQ